MCIRDSLIAASCGRGDLVSDPLAMADAASVAAPCDPGPSPDVKGDETIDANLRAEALVEFLTGVDPILIPETEGADLSYGPNFGGVWGLADGSDTWVVALIECDNVDLDRLAELAGGSSLVQVIEVQHSLDEMNRRSGVLATQLEELGDGYVNAEHTLSGIELQVFVEDPEQLPDDFGLGIDFTVMQQPAIDVDFDAPTLDG